jgi:fumarylacetoacetate (FAA) hydrolase
VRLATLDDGTRDGELVVVDTSGTRQRSAKRVAKTLQQALDDWPRVEPALRALAEELAADGGDAAALELERLLAPLPRAFEWVDGSAYLNHIRLVRRARGAELPPTLETDPLVYQGGSGVLLGSRAAIPLPDPAWGLDFEGEVCVVLKDVPRGIAAAEVAPEVALLMLANDLSYRHLIPAEVAKGFGFFNSKPATAFSAFAVTPDELGSAWRGGRLHLPLRCALNGRVVGAPNAGSGMHFSFYELVAHIAKTRAFTAGTILGGGTVSNDDPAAGVACLAELRCLETLESGAPRTPFLLAGDRVRIEMRDSTGRDIFGGIEQEVLAV